MPHPYKPLPEGSAFGSGLLLDGAIAFLAILLGALLCAPPS